MFVPINNNKKNNKDNNNNDDDEVLEYFEHGDNTEYGSRNDSKRII